MPGNGCQWRQLLFLAILYCHECHLRPTCRTGSRIGKPEVLIKDQELARNAAKMHSNGKRRTKRHTGRTELEPEVVLAAIFDL